MNIVGKRIPYIVDKASTLIHIANLAQSGTKSVVLTATIDGAGSELVRIAAYVVASSSYTYKGLLGVSADTNNTACGTITGPTGDPVTQQSANSLKTQSTVAGATGINLGNVDPQTEITVAVYVWLDGATFDEAESNKQASIALTFTAAAAQA